MRSLVRGPGQFASTTAMDADDLFRRERLSLAGDWQWQARAAVPPRTPPTLRERNFLLKTIDTDQLSPKLGLRYDIAQSLQVFAQYALGFRAPPASDVNIGFTIPAFNYRAIPNPELRPEHSRGVELGLRLSDGWGSAELVIYDNRYSDLIDSRVNLGTDASGSQIFQSINRSRARIRGIEARAEVGLPVETLSLQASLAWGRGDDLVRHLPLNSVEPGKLTLGLVWEPMPMYRLGLVGTARRQAAHRPWQPPAVRGTRPWPARCVLELADRRALDPVCRRPQPRRQALLALERRARALRRCPRGRSVHAAGAFLDWVDGQFQRQGLLPRKPFTQALAYARERRAGLEVFLADPDAPVDTNHLERALRAIPMGRKAWLFCWTELGAEQVGIV